jgi:hypothetical protein
MFTHSKTSRGHAQKTLQRSTIQLYFSIASSISRKYATVYSFAACRKPDWGGVYGCFDFVETPIHPTKPPFLWSFSPTNSPKRACCTASERQGSAYLRKISAACRIGEAFCVLSFAGALQRHDLRFVLQNYLKIMMIGTHVGQTHQTNFQAYCFPDEIIVPHYVTGLGYPDG